ncbi:MAG: type II toxin-antitoxin system VapC family toxin [Nitrospirae bacterium]|nr:type II toxin-antitoxin system VapC family toxin [Nitrospirota bacterium]
MNVFLDSSALGKRYVEEAGSDQVADILARASSLGLCVIAPTEVVSALCRLRRERRLTREQYGKAKAALFRDVGDATVIGLTDGVIARAVGLLERCPLRSSDALHLACAAEWSCDLFVSADDRQCAAAKGYGLTVERLPLA